jgi:hypothetical protein
MSEPLFDSRKKHAEIDRSLLNILAQVQLRVATLDHLGFNPQSLEIVLGSETDMQISAMRAKLGGMWFDAITIGPSGTGTLHGGFIAGVAVVVDTATPRLLTVRPKIDVILARKRAP